MVKCGPCREDVGLPPLVCSLWNRKCSDYRKHLTFSQMVIRPEKPGASLKTKRSPKVMCLEDACSYKDRKYTRK